MFIKFTCRIKEKSAYELAEELSLTARYIARKYLRPLVQAGCLSVTKGERGIHLYKTKVK